ncbi:tetraacyldisaccharide 4'-kinase [Agaribacterium haliotis]|uniref:tetraacyldisaccharide 4'-kinase n=1 Tax=Agaribacterium haliotis TaxID=2013869 RepID=UPI000BB58965|nr:tetraacyldisaccharide 4'-kinase [Agaribacterium haliotis]
MPVPSLVKTIEKQWYSDSAGLLALLSPLESLYRCLSKQNKRRQLAKQQSNKLPVVVVGNISVGGTGKTPLIIALIKRLQAEGLRAGVVSRGYGRSTKGLKKVSADSRADEVGDEPLEIFLATGAGVWVAEARCDAVAAAEKSNAIDLILSDDGLQHYRMARDIEVAVIGPQGLGNGHLLPVGPLREAPSRLDTVDFIIQRSDQPIKTAAPQFPLSFAGGAWRKLTTSVKGDKLKRDAEHRFASLPKQDKKLIAYAGIGQPQRFFDELSRQGLEFEARAKKDHGRYQASDFSSEFCYLMTAKDAVKCRELFSEGAEPLELNGRNALDKSNAPDKSNTGSQSHSEQHQDIDIYYYELNVCLNEDFFSAFLQKLKSLKKINL